MKKLRYLWDRLVFRLIRLLAGKRLVILNAEFRGGTITNRFGSRGMVANSLFGPPEPAPPSEAVVIGGRVILQRRP